MNPKNKPNGHGALVAKGSGAHGRTISLSGMGRAASDDASELSVANAAASTAAAGADREAYADVAPFEGDGERRSSAAAAPPRTSKDLSAKTRKVPPGSELLPIDAEAFVDAVHSRVDLVLLEEKLLQSKDEKIVQRELAYLRELRYGKRAPAGEDEPTQIIFDMPGPERDKQ